MEKIILKLLFITLSIPYPPNNGGKCRVYGLLSHFKKWHDIILFAPSRLDTDEEGIRHLEQIGIKVETASRPAGIGKIIAVSKRVKAFFSPVPMNWVTSWDDTIACAIREAVKKHDPDVIMIEHLSMWRFHNSFAVGKPLVLGEQNVESKLEAELRRIKSNTLAGLLHRKEAKKVEVFESKMMLLADLVVAVSNEDMTELRRLAPSAKFEVIPNGVDIEQFTPSFCEQKAHQADSSEDEIRTRGNIVFTGTLSYAPNEEAAIFMVREIMPLVQNEFPNAHLKIVGRDPGACVCKLACKEIEVIRNVPDMKPYIADADVVAVPLLSGSGTRIKILESMAMGKAVVSTSRGAEGLDVRDGYDILVRDNPKDFAKAIIDLIKSPEVREEIGLSARKTVESKYGWDAIASKLADELKALTNS